MKYQTCAILNNQEMAELEMESTQKPEQLPRNPLPCPSKIIGMSHINARERELLIFGTLFFVPNNLHILKCLLLITILGKREFMLACGMRVTVLFPFYVTAN